MQVIVLVFLVRRGAALLTRAPPHPPPSGAIDIATALKTNKTLVNMNLSQNQIGDPGAGELADMLEKNTTLKLLK